MLVFVFVFVPVCQGANPAHTCAPRAFGTAACPLFPRLPWRAVQPCAPVGCAAFSAARRAAAACAAAPPAMLLGSAAALALSQSPAPNTLHFLATQSAGAAAAAAAALPRLAALVCWHHRAPPAVCCCVFMFTRTWCRQLPHAPHLAMRTHHQPPVYPRLCPAPGACTESQASHRPGRISLFHQDENACMQITQAQDGRGRAAAHKLPCTSQRPLHKNPGRRPFSKMFRRRGACHKSSAHT